MGGYCIVACGLGKVGREGRAGWVGGRLDGEIWNGRS